MAAQINTSAPESFSALNYQNTSANTCWCEHLLYEAGELNMDCSCEKPVLQEKICVHGRAGIPKLRVVNSVSSSKLIAYRDTKAAITKQYKKMELIRMINNKDLAKSDH